MWAVSAQIALTLLACCMAKKLGDPEELLNWCLDGKNHKEKPGPEGELFSQCTPWKNRSCCTYNTTKNIHESRMYNFNYNHCNQIRNMSENCKRHFTQDHCFYECSPNIGPWVVKVNMKMRKERYYQVPLCASDCETWFLACQDDFTCTDNWIRNFIWVKGERNSCLRQAECRTFRQIFGTPNNFCQKVWDDSWKVVPDSEACMRLWFDGSDGNPNDNIARDKVRQMMAHSAASLYNSHALLSLVLLVVS
ncbi:folate receptor beta-like [Macrosteles quadrilineatus]|uniref:folate receptor beta-like n=1 Tax=Macrosteles quadrilineatus TaxID=74068 RepID=UPI0023E1CFB3|nr:folate receptor beta-like [Macrosteles quadrilineatus]